ncbi:MAG: hypothetical protein AVDCRST_MAG43-2267, partial [uncultured Thermomicrobiales bacterium]
GRCDAAVSTPPGTAGRDRTVVHARQRVCVAKGAGIHVHPVGSSPAAADRGSSGRHDGGALGPSRAI